MNYKTVLIVLTIFAIPAVSASGSAPNADLTVNPNPATVGESLTFDASSSSGDIDKYYFDLDGDGQYEEQGPDSAVQKTFSSPGKFTAKLKVEDDHGRTDTAQQYYEVREDQRDCSTIAGFIHVNGDDLDEGESFESWIYAYNRGDPQEVRATFFYNGDQIAQSTKTVDDVSRFSTVYAPSESGQVGVQLDTLGEPCGDEEIQEDYESVRVYEDLRRASQINVMVEDFQGDRIEGARLDLSGREGALATSDSDGTHTFDVRPGNYRLEATRDGYTGETVDITQLERNEERTVRVRLRDTDASSNLEVNVEDQDGDRLEDARVRVENSDIFTERTDSSGTAAFELEPENYDVRVSRNGYFAEIRTVEMEPGESSQLTVRLQRQNTEKEEAELEVNVEDEDGFSLENARVEVENSEDQVRFTGNNGRSSFDLEPDTYDVTVSKNNYDTEERTVTLEEGDYRQVEFRLQREDTDDEEARLEVEAEDEDGDELRDARIEVENGDREVRRTNSDGTAVFFLEPDEYDVEVSKAGYDTEDRSIDLDEGDDRTLRFTLDERRRDEDARLDVEVENEDGDELRDARVRVENGDDRTEFTDRDGEARFYLEPDRYDIRVSRSGYFTERRTVLLSDGERETERFTLERSSSGISDLEIRNVRLSKSTVCRGDTVHANVEVRNNGPRETVTFGARGTGSTVAKQAVLDRNEERNVQLTITNIKGSGIETLEIAVTNGDTDTFTRSITVEDCGRQQPDDTVSSISVNVQPGEVTVGQNVRVSGFVDGTRGPEEVEIFIDGSKVADTTTARDGYFQTHVAPQNIGSVSIEARAGGRSATGSVRVLPNVYVASVSSPDRVFESDEFELCADVQSQATPSVVLYRDGQRIDSQSGKGNVCFDTSASAGERHYRVEASAYGVTDSKSRTVEVLDDGSEAENFPDKLAMIRSGDGIVRVSLYNTGDEKRTYDVSVDGIPEDWFSTSDKEVVLTMGERKNVYFYVTPEAEGQFVADVDVERNGQQIYSSDVSISSGGTNEEHRKTWIERIASLFGNS